FRPIMTTPETGYALRAADLDAAITARTKWLVLNSPSNPSGTAYGRAQLAEFAEVIRNSANQRFFILVDDIYEHILYDGRAFHTLAQVAPDL
ncbi:aminotransferase class I/II-fold pyridoxal phosphate-dependent enzyme, partial [Campylobacter coli]|uniref:aminotransferase class I/II-fold pyridoxal phosphate-dependent enzyme n=4 Tax=Pseudomonadati TaxID=3379134 RepID=UPI001F096F6A